MCGRVWLKRIIILHVGSRACGSTMWPGYMPAWPPWAMHPMQPGYQMLGMPTAPLHMPAGTPTPSGPWPTVSADPYAGTPVPSDPWSTAGADPWASAAVAVQAAAIAAATAPQMASPGQSAQGPAMQPPPWPAPGFIAQSGPAAATYPSGNTADGWSLDLPAQPTQPTCNGLGG